jgi:hypothetical protein
MKNLTLAGVLIGPLIVVSHPAAAAGLEETATVRSGTFAGARMRISLGGGPEDGKLRAGFTLAPTLRSHTLSGETRLRFGEGVNWASRESAR